MNLTDYPTPRTDQFRAEDNGDTSWVFEECERIEREAAAWRDVATRLATEMRDVAWLAGPAGGISPNNAELAIDAFDRLLAQTSTNDEHAKTSQKGA